MSSDHLEEPGETQQPEQGGGSAGHRAEHAGWSIRLVAIGILCAILIVLVFIALALYGGNRNEKAKTSDATLGNLAAQVKDACTANPADARKVFGDVCGKAKAIDERPAGEKGDPGEPGRQGNQGVQGVQGPPPSDAQVASAVASYCTSGRCAGKGPSASQVAAAVSAYCNARGQCQGPGGEPGSPGSPGSAGSPGAQGSPGVQGPGPTDAQIAAAVTSYCGQETNPCQGTPGQTGAPGVPGSQGRGVVSVECVNDADSSHWLITYDRPDSDGKSTQAVDGPCRLQSGPTVPPITGSLR